MAIKAGFSLNPFPPISESEGEGRGAYSVGGAYLTLWPGGWRLLERGRLFEEIRYILTALAERESARLC